MVAITRISYSRRAVGAVDSGLGDEHQTTNSGESEVPNPSGRAISLTIIQIVA